GGASPPRAPGPWGGAARGAPAAAPSSAPLLPALFAGVHLGEELERGAIPRLRLIAVCEVAGRREDDQLRPAHLLLHDRHRLERRVAIAADQERGDADQRELIGDVVHREERA